MARTVVLDEVRLVIRIPTQLPARHVARLRRAILHPRLAQQLRTSARNTLVALCPVKDLVVRIAVTPAR